MYCFDVKCFLLDIVLGHGCMLFSHVPPPYPFIAWNGSFRPIRFFWNSPREASSYNAGCLILNGKKNWMEGLNDRIPVDSWRIAKMVQSWQVWYIFKHLFSETHRFRLIGISKVTGAFLANAHHIYIYITFFLISRWSRTELTGLSCNAEERQLVLSVLLNLIPDSGSEETCHVGRSPAAGKGHTTINQKSMIHRRLAEAFSFFFF